MEYIEKMKTIQNAILECLDDESDKILDKLTELLNNQKNLKDVHELKSILYLILNIFQNHHRGPFFFDKIKAIINILKSDIKDSFSNDEIFTIFKANKRILLLLIDEDILTIDNEISEELSTYGDYFYPEIQKFNQKRLEDGQNKELPENFEEKRRSGENDSLVSELIRNDDIDEFIINYNKNNYSLNDKINYSIFESNQFLNENEPTLIEYALFFGSIRIFKFLRENRIELKPSSWIYAIHGKNPEIIQIIESDEKIFPEDKSYKQCYTESIKCHHNDFALYIKENLLINEENQNNTLFSA